MRAAKKNLREPFGPRRP